MMIFRLLPAALVGCFTLQAADLPDPLVANDGSRIANAEQWQENRQPELLEFLTREM